MVGLAGEKMTSHANNGSTAIARREADLRRNSNSLDPALGARLLRIETILPSDTLS
jgi:hypothetical protein